MRLLDLVNRQPLPEPWAEGDNIPWHDPAFSERMLLEHLSQSHDAASRRFPKIDEQVAWIHGHVLAECPSRILDLGCGPGLYASRLAALGHRCVGIDYSPASIAHARREAERADLPCTYALGDIRQVAYGTGFDLAMLLYGELNVFRPSDARTILLKAHEALAEGGLLLLEPHTFEAMQRIGQEPPRWRTQLSGLFSERPHLYLTESFWDDARAVATNRYFVVDAATGDVARYAQSMQAYTEEGYRALLTGCGFGDPVLYPSLIGQEDASQDGLLVIVARKER
ncbi:MAG: class I SAM-dependent methyltransferase [Chloroflexi bacterium]|nr:class I SAM-dependent methyltransferase [Chloroflexota bacterium]